MMRRRLNEYDRVIFICSETSLQRRGVLFELKETLAREARDGGNEYLIPVRLDDYVLNWAPPGREDMAIAVRDRVIADFRNHQDEPTFQAELAKLIAALKKNPPKPLAHV